MRGDCVKIPGLVKAEHHSIDPSFWQDRRVLVTGHTGFKGAWLSLWLQWLGARVSGLSRGMPTRGPSVYELAGVGGGMEELAVDVRDGRAVREALAQARPEIVLHLAAQPLVRRSLRDPVGTYEVNVMGTVNVLEAVRELAGGVRAVVVVTSDKSYENPGGRTRSFVEGDPLGGEDPYSSSKACAELVASAYRRSFFSTGPDGGGPRVATARAGNVIGGGDWGEDRLMADAVRAVERGEPLLVRNPQSVRPWQHVLGPLGGYLLLAQALCSSTAAARAWNFGPRPGAERTVGWIVERLGELWEGALRWELDERPNPPEAPYLALDSSAAERELGWRPPWGLEDGLGLVVEWHRAQRGGAAMRDTSLAQIARFAGSS
jgi:CDP-glucose 4,6-dehydratase